MVVDEGAEIAWLVDDPDTQLGAVRCHERGERPARPFVRLLATFNAHVPTGGAAALEVRVRECVTGDWSPWLRMLDWGDLRSDWPRVVEFDGGRVEVDTLVCEHEQDAFDWRVLTSGTRAADVERVSITLSARALDLAGAAPRHSAPDAWPRALDVPRRSQRVEDPAIASRVCSPTSVAMVLQFHGVDRSTAAVAQRLFDKRHDVYGNWARAVQGAFEFGVPGVLACFEDWRAVAALIERGCPLVVSIAVPEGALDGAPYLSTSGHLVVLCGFDEHGDVIVNDPADKDVSTSRRTYRREQFERVWMDRGGTAYVLFESAH